MAPHRPEVLGVNLDPQTRCEHYHGPTDIIAIKMKCCGRYYACKECHVSRSVDTRSSCGRGASGIRKEYFAALAAGSLAFESTWIADIGARRVTRGSILDAETTITTISRWGNLWRGHERCTQ